MLLPFAHPCFDHPLHGNVLHVTSDTRPSCFSRVMLKSWEWPGDEGILGKCVDVISNKTLFMAVFLSLVGYAQCMPFSPFMGCPDH